MLDTHARRYINPAINYTAKILLKLNMKPNHITAIAFLVGILASVFIVLDKKIVACIILWSSGFLDAVDGAMARESKQTSKFGTLMDITFDRIVELFLIIAFAIEFHHIRFQLVILTCAIVFSMTIFLTVGALSQNTGKKSFYYQAGIAERTEGFILFTLMILFSNQIKVITLIYAILVFVTGLQRFFEARNLFMNME